MQQRESSTQHHSGFTIIELLVVIAIVMILLSLLLPTLRQTKDTARMAQCTSNLHQLRIAMQGFKGITHHQHLPNAGSWTGVVGQRGAGQAMICPMDVELNRGPGGIDDMSLVQWPNTGHPDDGHVIKTPLPDIVAGSGLPDDQVSWFTNSAQHIGNQFNGEDEFKSTLGVSEWSELPGGTVAVSVDWSGRFTISGGTITVYHSWPGDSSGQSRHFIYRGDEEVAEIGGGTHPFTNNQPHPGYTPPLVIDGTGVGVSYGMNSLIVDRPAPSEQVLLVDYEKHVIEMGTDGQAIDDFDEHFAPRHFGKANVMFEDGSIRLMTRGELESQPELWLADDAAAP